MQFGLRQVITVASLLLLATISAVAQRPNTRPPCERFRLPANRIVDNEAVGDVTGDGVDDGIFVLAQRNDPGSEFATLHEVALLDGSTGRQTVLPLGSDSGGYPGTLFLGDVNGDRVEDIFIGLPTGGSGGIINYFLLTAQGGTLRFLVAPQVLMRGPSWDVSLQSGFRVRITNRELKKTFYVTLRASNYGGQAEMLRTYQGVYAPSGQILKPTTCVVDPYGEMEPREIGNLGVFELVGYQSIWVLFHANTVAYARSTWRWRDNALHLVDVRIIQPYPVDTYAQELSRLGVARPATSVSRAVALYRQHFADDAPVFRDAAFQRFLTFHRRVQQAAARQFQRGGSAQMAQAFNATPANRAAGLVAVYEGEGMWTVVGRPDFYAQNFNAYLTPDYRDFLVLQGRELTEPYARDAALVISLTALGRRVSEWEAFIGRYPDTTFKDEAQRYFTNELTALLVGTNNTPHFDYQTRRMRSGVANALRLYAQTHAESQSGMLVSRMLTLYAQANYTRTPALETAIQQQLAALNPSVAANYFPLAVGNIWSYPTGSFENAGARVTVAYGRDNRFQLNTESTGARGIQIYEIRDGTVVLVYQNDETNSTENQLAKPNATQEIRLQGPITVGTTWTSNGMRYEIRRVNQTVRVLCRTYQRTIEMVRTPVNVQGDNAYSIADYYALGVGLVASIYQTPTTNSEMLLGEHKLAM